MSTNNGGFVAAVSSHWHLVTAYFILCSFLYLYGYWSPFGINIAEYISFTDGVAFSAYPVFVALIFIVVTTGFSSVINISDPDEVDKIKNPPTKVGLFIGRNIKWFLFAYALALMLYAVMGRPDKWYVIALLIASPVGIYLHDRKIFSDFIPHYYLRVIFLMTAFALPMYSYGAGSVKAYQIINGGYYQYVTSKLAGIDPSKQAALRLLGHASDQLFFYDSQDRSVVIVDMKGSLPIEITIRTNKAKVAKT